MKETIAKGGIEESRLTVLHNFIEKNNKDYTLQTNEKYVLYFGRISIEKGIKTLVDVIKELPHIKFVFVGDGPLE
ncbi:Glycosyltransferase, partial [human gut metagenome]